MAMTEREAEAIKLAWDTAAATYGIPVRYLVSRRRVVPTPSARYLAMRLLAEQDFTHEKIAEAFGMDRSSVTVGVGLCSVSKARALLEEGLERRLKQCANISGALAKIKGL